MQDSLKVIYKTLEDTIKAMDNVPGMMTEFSGALGSFTQQQLAAYMQFTEAREQLNEYEKQLETRPRPSTRRPSNQALAQRGCDQAAGYQDPCHPRSTPRTSPCRPVTCKDDSGESWLLKVGEEYNSVEDIRGATAAPCGGLRRCAPSDVADVEIIDNAADSYTRLNGEQAAVLKIYKERQLQRR